MITYKKLKAKSDFFKNIKNTLNILYYFKQVLNQINIKKIFEARQKIKYNTNIRIK